MPEKRAVALGFFDGIHLGHAALLRRLVEVGGITGYRPAVISFDVMPQNLLFNKAVPLINTPGDRAHLISRSFNIEDIILLRFDRQMADMGCDAFIDMLITEYNAGHIIAGANFKFGKGAGGNSGLLKKKCAVSGIGCDIIPDVVLDNVVVSSTYIRELLQSGMAERANTFLGHPHILSGTVGEGKKLGSKIGVPTLNMKIPPGILVPAYGVYATKVYIFCDNLSSAYLQENPEMSVFSGVTNIGIRPTVDNDGSITVETHIADFEQNVYGCRVRLEFHKYLRTEKKFASIDALKAQIKKDCAAMKKYFA